MPSLSVRFSSERFLERFVKREKEIKLISNLRGLALKPMFVGRMRVCYALLTKLHLDIVSYFE